MIKKILKLPIINTVVEYSKRKSLPGFRGVSIYRVIEFVITEARRYDITTRANSVAFSFFIAIFPTIIFLFTLIPYLPIDVDLLTAFNDSTKNILPEAAHSYLFEILNDVVNTSRSGLGSFGFLLAIFFASSGMLTLMTGFDKNYKAFTHRNFLNKRLMALYLTVLLSGLFIVSLLLIVFGKQFLMYGMNFIDQEAVAKYSLYAIRIIVSFFILYIGITLIYRLGPTLVNKVPFWNPGAIVATFLSILSSLLFAYYVNRFGRYNELYGSIGALIVVMIWLQINAFIIIIGFELNASIAVGQFEKEDYSKLS